MKFFTFSSLAAAAIASAVLVLPFRPAEDAATVDSFVLELRMASSAAGHVQLYYPDPQGAMTESASSRTPVTPGQSASVYRLPLPGGNYSTLRLDPIDTAGTVTIESMRFVAHSGRMARAVAFPEVRGHTQIGSVEERDGRLEIITTPHSTDAQLLISLRPPAELRATFFERRKGFAVRALSVFAAMAAFLFFLERRPRSLARSCSKAFRWFASSDKSAVAAVAALAVVLSAYPVVFLGKSHVSPNFGTPLLYDGFPTLPNSTGTEVVNPMGADVGAMMWAHLPYSVVAHRALSQGEFPLWNRYNSLGSPLLAQGQSMLGDPLHAGVILGRGHAWAWDLKYLLAKWLFATGLGLSVLALYHRRDEQAKLAGGDIAASKANIVAALIVAGTAPFIGFFIYRINHAAYFSLCYAPWPLYCLIRFAQAASRREAAKWIGGLVVANLALMNSGTVKEAYVLLLMMNFSDACVLLAGHAPGRVRLLKLAALGWSGLLFVLITIPVWGSFVSTLANARTNYDVPIAYQIQPSLLLGAFDEAFYRLIPLAECIFNPSSNFAVLLGLLYFLATLRFLGSDRTIIALAASAVVPLALAFGLVPASWIVAVPLIGKVHHIDNCFSCVLIILWAILAGAGFVSAAQRIGTPEGRKDLMVVAGLMFGLVFAWIAFRQTAHRGYSGPDGTLSVVVPGQVRAVSDFVWGYLATLLAASVVLALTIRRVLVRRALSPAAGIVIASCLVLLLWRHGLQAESVDFEQHVVRPPARTNLHAPSPAMEFVRTLHAREPSRGYGMANNFFMGWTGVYGLEAINSPDALVNPWLHELVVRSGTTPGITWDFWVAPEILPKVRPFFDAINVRYYFDRGHDRAPLRRSLKLIKSLDLDVWESSSAWPRAFFTDRIHVYDTADQFMDKIKTGDGRPFAAVQRSDAAALRGLSALEGNLADRTISAATQYLLGENTTEFTIHANGPGVAVLSETFWPGDFRCEINGRKAPVLRLNHAFKGAAIDAAGDYQIVFRYLPKNFPRNLLLSAIGTTVFGLSLWLALRPPRAASSRKLHDEAGDSRERSLF